jgi:transketolase
VEHAKELQKELQKHSEEQRVEYAEELQKYKEEQQVEQTKEVQRKLQKHIDKHQAKHARELQAKEQGIANRLQRAVDIQVEATTILRTILHVDVANEIFTHPRIDPHLDEWDATNTK